MRFVDLRERLERLYRLRARPEYIGPDPLGFVRQWQDPADQEVVGLLAASLAYGRVHQIHTSLRELLRRIERPAELAACSEETIAARLAGFRHRFHDAGAVAGLLAAAGRVRAHYGSLAACLVSHDRPEEHTVLGALQGLARELAACARASAAAPMPLPERGSACKRWHLFLRWMVRRDAVDPGPWAPLVAPRRLVVPLDAHLHRIGIALGFTQRVRPDQRAALQVTAGFRRVAPEDPVRYDFCLARAAMEGELERFGIPEAAPAGHGCERCDAAAG